MKVYLRVSSVIMS